MTWSVDEERFACFCLRDAQGVNSAIELYLRLDITRRKVLGFDMPCIK